MHQNSDNSGNSGRTIFDEFYVDRGKKLAGEFFSDLNQISGHLSKQQIRHIFGRLNDPRQFWSVLPEIEWAALFTRSNFSDIDIEPFSPRRGPDLRVRFPSRDVYFEVKAPGGLEDDFKLQTCLPAIARMILAGYSEKSTHVYLTDRFPWQNSPDFIRMVETNADGLVPYGTAFYLDKKRWHVVHAVFSPLFGIGERYDIERVWIRRNFSQMYPAAVYPSWVNAFRDWHVDLDSAPKKFQAIFSIDHSPSDAVSTFVTIAEGGNDKRRDNIRWLVGRSKRQSVPNAPYILVVDVSRLLFVTEVDVIRAVFGHEYARNWLMYTLDIAEVPPNSTIAECPSHVSALICYSKFLKKGLARIYMNPRAITPLTDKELDILTNNLRLDIMNGVQRHALDDEFIIHDAGREKFRTQIEKFIDSLFKDEIVHIIDTQDVVSVGLKWRLNELAKKENF